MFKFGSEAQHNVFEGRNSHKKENLLTDFKWDLCDYKTQKLVTLKKHINSKHTEQKCKACGVKFKTSMQLVSHVANEHNEEEECKVEFHSTPKEEGSS